MPRIARIVAPGRAHHVTQRGNRRMETFFCDEDYQEYLALLAHWCGEFDVRIWSYCLMPNHVHLILVPSTVEGLAQAVAEVHRRYTRMINFREGWRGHLWQGRFASFVMSEKHLMSNATRSRPSWSSGPKIGPGPAPRPTVRRAMEGRLGT